MKNLTFFFLLLFFTPVVVANNLDDMPLITIQSKSISIKDALKSVEKQSKVHVMYLENLIDKSKRLDLNLKNVTLEKALDNICNPVRLKYEFIDDYILITKEKKSNMTSVTNVSMPQTIVISGKISDEKNEVLAGASIKVKEIPTTGTISDNNGLFTLSLETATNNSITLMFSFLGFETKTIKYSGESFLNIKLSESESFIEEVVVTGYQSISKERATGAFTNINFERIDQSHSSDLSTTLLGAVAGMQGKERADGAIDYIIRGQTSLYADVAPLVVVDGFPVANGFRDINPNDVESISVLKDAAAASIWGARAANGVIVVTTKKAKKQGKLNVEVSSTLRMASKWDLNTVLTTASSEDQVYFEKLLVDNKWTTPPTDIITSLLSSLSLAKEYLYSHADGKISDQELNDALLQLSNTNNRGQIKNLLLENPVLQQYNISISNATDKMKNHISLMYETQTGNVIENKTERWRINFNNQTTLFKWMDINFGISSHFINGNTSGPALDEIRALSPYEMILNNDGSYATQLKKNRAQLAKFPAGVLPYSDWSYNLLREVRGRKFTNESLNNRLQAGLTVKFLPGLNFDSKFQYEYNKTETDNLYGEETFYVRDMINTYVEYDQTNKIVKAQFIPNGAILQSGTSGNKNYSLRNQLNFDKIIGNKHIIKVLIGTEISQNKTDGRTYPYVWGYNPQKNTSAYLPFGGYSFNKNGQLVQIRNITNALISSLPGINTAFNYRKDCFVSVYSNASYTFDNRYGISGSVRSDASNLITDNAAYRWAPFWSIGGLWNVKREKFMESTNDWLNRFSLRLTYGWNGNVEKSTSPVTLLSSSTSPATSTGLYTSNISNFGNPNLRWERTAATNMGFDFALLGNALFGTVEYYDKKGKDIIGNIALPSALGTSSQKMNNAKLSNTGVEITLGVNVPVIKRISLNSSITYACNKNKITNLYYPANTASQMINGNFMEGYPAQAMWAYNYLGMDNGIPYIEGPNGVPASMYSTATSTANLGIDFLQYYGPVVDPHTFGWQVGFDGYGFNLSALLTGKFGGHFRAPTYYVSADNNKSVATVFIKDIINGSDKIPSWPQVSAYGSSYAYTPNLNTLIESSSFVKLKEINMDYKLEPKWAHIAGLDVVKVFAQVRDLGCLWTDNIYGYDPEWLPGSAKPSFSVAFGINIKF